MGRARSSVDRNEVPFREGEVPAEPCVSAVRWLGGGITAAHYCRMGQVVGCDKQRAGTPNGSKIVGPRSAGHHLAVADRILKQQIAVCSEQKVAGSARSRTSD